MTAKLIERQIRLFVGFTKAKASEEDIQTLVRVLVGLAEAEPMTPKVWNKRDPNVPKDAVYVGRPTKWGNPFTIPTVGSRERAIELFKGALNRQLTDDAKRELRGKHLVCWCAPLPCHADVLLEIANG